MKDNEFYLQVKKDNQNRYNLTKYIIEMSELNNYVGPIAVCAAEDHWYLKKINEVEDCKVITKCVIDSKSRIILRLNINIIGVYVLNDIICFVPVEKN